MKITYKTSDADMHASTNTALSRVDAARVLSPRRKSSSAVSVEQLAVEQLEHFGVDPASSYGEALLSASEALYEVQADMDRLWKVTAETIEGLDRTDRIAWFNAKKFSLSRLRRFSIPCRIPSVRLIRSWICRMSLFRPRDRTPSSIM